jgi:universal stress protein A
MENYRHILYATAFSEGSRQACARAAALSGCGGGRLTLLHVVENFPQDHSIDLIEPEDVDPQRYREEQARDRLSILARESGCGHASLQVRFTDGPAWREIVRLAREDEVDLIVIGGAVHRPPATLAKTTRHALAEQPPCDVLTVNVPAQK